MDRHPTSREGITCIACHRIKNPYGKVSGRLAIVEGDIFDPVYGSLGNEILEEVTEEGSDFRVNTERGKSGRAIHADASELPQISTSAFCGTCHDVNLVNGFRLEEAFSEYKSTSAAKEVTTCQDCNMGEVPGKAEGYLEGPAAVVGGKPTTVRKRTNHMFAGPDYSIIHKGIFPHNDRAAEMATIRQWLTFDYEAGWGTEAFESNIPDGFEFPERWQFADDRYDAREIITQNEALLARLDEERLAVLRAGYVLGDVKVGSVGRSGIDFEVEFKNGTNGHNVPTGFDDQNKRKHDRFLSPCDPHRQDAHEHSAKKNRDFRV